jgi:hypothetical protein
MVHCPLSDEFTVGYPRERPALPLLCVSGQIVSNKKLRSFEKTYYPDTTSKNTGNTATAFFKEK